MAVAYSGMMSRTRVKFCGVMRPDDAVSAAKAGADAVGMILHANTKRRIDLVTAQRIVAVLPPYVATVGVFVNAPFDTIIGCMTGAPLQAAQLHGDETPDFVRRCGAIPVIKALRADTTLESQLELWRRAVAGGEVKNVIGILIDGPGGGGTGEVNDAKKLATIMARGGLNGLPPIVIAGGLTAERVGGVIQLLRPYAVDTSSGIEANVGEKSSEKMRAFTAAVAETDRNR